MGQAARRARRAPTCLTAGAAQALLQAGQLDELEIHLVPVLLGAGRRLFAADARAIELQLVRQLEGREVTHLRYQVRR
jgi:dihydrofolate reductase